MADQLPMGGGARSPEEILAELQALLAEYLAAGEGTPVAPEAQALMEAIQTAGTGSEGPMGTPPQDPMMEDPMLGEMSEEPMEPMPRTFKEANKEALPELERRNRKKSKV